MNVNFKSWKPWAVICVFMLIFAGIAVMVLRPDISKAIGVSSFFYDKNGNTVGQVFSLVKTPEGTEIEGAYSVILKPYVTSTSEKPISVKILSVEPSSIAQYFPTDSKTISPGQTAEWFTTMIPLAPFEGQTLPVKIIFEGSWMYAGQEYKETKSTPIFNFQILPDPVFGFDVGISPSQQAITNPCGDGVCDITSETYLTCAADCQAPVNPVSYCGDGVCDSSETYLTCGADCPAPVIEKVVKFRTNAPTCGTDKASCYSTNTWIAVDSDSDGLLNGWGYYSSSTVTTRQSATPTSTKPGLKGLGVTPEGFSVGIYYISGGYRVAVEVPTGTLSLPTWTYKLYQTASTIAVTTKTPTVPYSTNGQEVYV
jgi:hypothetical protein